MGVAWYEGGVLLFDVSDGRTLRKLKGHFLLKDAQRDPSLRFLVNIEHGHVTATSLSNLHEVDSPGAWPSGDSVEDQIVEIVASDAEFGQTLRRRNTIGTFASVPVQGGDYLLGPPTGENAKGVTLLNLTNGRRNLIQVSSDCTRTDDIDAIGMRLMVSCGTGREVRVELYHLHNSLAPSSPIVLKSPGGATNGRFAHRAHLIRTIGANQSIQIWNADTGALVRAIDVGGSIVAADWSSTDRLLVVRSAAEQQHSIALWSVETGTQTIASPQSPTRPLAIGVADAMGWRVAKRMGAAPPQSFILFNQGGRETLTYGDQTDWSVRSLTHDLQERPSGRAIGEAATSLPQSQQRKG